MLPFALCCALQVASYVAQGLAQGHHPQAVAEGLVRECLVPERTAGDNITAIVIELKEQGQG